MNTAIVLAIIVGSALAAPTEDILESTDSQQTRSSPYGSPCGGGAPLAPVALYLSPQSPHYGSLGHYREDENKEEHNEQARSYYESSAVGAVGSYGGAGPAVGVFPHAKVGGCAVPLLLSCAPNVVSGHLAHSAYGGHAGPAYRALEPENPKEAKEIEEEKSWSEAERTAHHQKLEFQDAQASHHHHHILPSEFHHHHHHPSHLEFAHHGLHQHHGLHGKF